MMRIAVTGKAGQVVQALAERGVGRAKIMPIGRPEFDLTDARAGIGVLTALRPDVIVSAAAYTAVDQAESEPAVADAVNRAGPGSLAECAASLGVPIIHISTDYVFDGTKDAAYGEDDAANPLGVYGQTKLAGERAVAAGTDNYVVLRTGWVYSPFGGNFVRTMLRLAATGVPEVQVVGDQVGSPTSALDLADAVLVLARNLVDRPQDMSLRGTFHLAGESHASRAAFAAAILAASAAAGGPSAAVAPVSTAQYPTAARRPANSRLQIHRLARFHGVTVPAWQISMPKVVARLVAGARNP